MSLSRFIQEAKGITCLLTDFSGRAKRITPLLLSPRSIAFEMRYTAARRVCSGSLGIPTREEPGIPGPPAAKRTRKHKHIDNNNMKKTIIALLALAGVAAAADEVKPITLTTTFKADVTATCNLADFTAEDLSLTNTDTGNALSSMVAEGDDFKSGSLRPNINVDNGSGSWTLDFTISNSGAKDLTVNSITLNAFAFNGSGTVQVNNRNFLFTVSADDTTIATDTNLYIAGNSTNGGTLTIDLTDSLTIAAKDNMTFSIEVAQGAEGNNSRGAFLGLDTVSFIGTMSVPEPTTATLSLLALAGLAARRRRK